MRPVVINVERERVQHSVQFLKSISRMALRVHRFGHLADVFHILAVSSQRVKELCVHRAKHPFDEASESGFARRPSLQENFIRRGQRFEKNALKLLATIDYQTSRESAVPFDA